MTMKIKIFYLSVVLVFISSCKDVLDITPDGRLTVDEAFASEKGTGAMLNSCYQNIPQLGYNWYYFDDALTSLSDDAYATQAGAAFPTGLMYDGTSVADWHWLVVNKESDYPPANTNLGQQWVKCYSQIRLCTQFLDNIDGANVLDESRKKRWKAEAYILRSYFYLQLIQWFGDVPLLERYYSYNDDFSKLKRNSVYDVAKFIVANCDSAIAIPDENFDGNAWKITSGWEERERVTKALACFIKAKAMLFAASPLFNKGENHWEEAYQVCKSSYEAVSNHGYKLYDQVHNPAVFGTGKGAAYNEYFCSRAECTPTDIDNETIWQCTRLAGPSAYIMDYGYLGGPRACNYIAGTGPSQELVDAFEVVQYQDNDPTKPIVSSKPLLKLDMPYLDEETHLIPNFNVDAQSEYNERSSGVPINHGNTAPAGPYWNRDPRLRKIVYVNDDPLIDDKGMPVFAEMFVGGFEGLDFGKSMTLTKTGYYPRKFVPYGKSLVDKVYYWWWKSARLGELMLNYAEAAAEAGHLADAVKMVNLIRNRANMPDLQQSQCNVGDQAEVIRRVRNERRVELAFEDIRYFDLRRWTTPDGNMSKTCKWFTAMQITKDEINKTYGYKRVNIRPTPRYGYENKDLLLPIPPSEVSNMQGISGENWQNPGW